MSAPLSNELFFEAHRGIRLRSGNFFKINKENLGTHWTANEQVARDFGGINFQPEAGHVYHAQIPVSSVESDTNKLKESQVITKSGQSFNEDEIPVKPGAKIKVTGRTTYRETSKADPKGRKDLAIIPLRTRTRKYNPPRQMNA